MRTLILIPILGACAAEPLSAVDDQITIEMDATAELDIVENDVGVDEARTLVLVDTAMHGRATLGDDGILKYKPAATYVGDDVVHYRITNPDGKTAEAAVHLTMHCETCAHGVPAELAWDANAPSDMVLGYRMYTGPTEDPATMKQIDDIAIDRPGFDAAHPSVTYDCWNDLHVRLGETVCFRLTAYNAGGESGFSNAACKLVDGKPMRFGI